MIQIRNADYMEVVEEGCKVASSLQSTEVVCASGRSTRRLRGVVLIELVPSRTTSITVYHQGKRNHHRQFAIQAGAVLFFIQRSGRGALLQDLLGLGCLQVAPCSGGPTMLEVCV